MSLVCQCLQPMARVGRGFDVKLVARCETRLRWDAGHKKATASLTGWNQKAKVACRSMRRFAEPLENGPP